MQLNHKLEPCYKILKYAAGGNILLAETPWFKNRLTDQGFENWIGSSSTGTDSLFSFCALGNGTGVPQIQTPQFLKLAIDLEKLLERMI